MLSDYPAGHWMRYARLHIHVGHIFHCSIPIFEGLKMAQYVQKHVAHLVHIGERMLLCG
jgi:hypothetical protein